MHTSRAALDRLLDPDIDTLRDHVDPRRPVQAGLDKGEARNALATDAPRKQVPLDDALLQYHPFVSMRGAYSR